MSLVLTPEPGPVLVNKGELAGILGVTVATVSAWVFGTRAGSRFWRACASSAGICSMRAVADFRRSGMGANSRVIRL